MGLRRVVQLVVQLGLLVLCASILIAAFLNREMAHLPDAVPNVVVPAPEAAPAPAPPEIEPAPGSSAAKAAAERPKAIAK